MSTTIYESSQSSNRESSPRQSSQKQSSNRESSPRESSNRESSPRESSQKQSSGKNTVKRSNTKNPSRNTVKRSTEAANINPPKPIYSEQIDRFKTYFEQSFAAYDEANPKYKITKMMLENYILTNIDDFNKRSIWTDFFINNRHLLYLDQYLNLLNVIISQPISIEYLSSNYNYFNLPIASSVNRGIRFFSNYEYILQEITKKYNDSIYKQMVKYQSGILETTTKNITDISLISAHGVIFGSAEFIKVPNDIVIAFVIPINKFGYQINDDIENIKNILINMQNNPNLSEKQDFFNNPACSFRNTGCLNQTVYYYPGQYIPNFSFMIIPGENDEHFGIYKNLQEPKFVEPIFELNSNTYYLNISDIVTKHHDYFKKQIIYIRCCRKCDVQLKKQTVELLYRYEHIITHLNMSYCLSLANNSNKYKCTTDKAGPELYKLATNTKNPSLFYDSATLGMFQSNKLPKYPKSNYMGETLAANNIVSFISNPRNTDLNKKNVLIEVLKYLVNDLEYEYTNAKVNKLTTIFENYIIPEQDLIYILTKYNSYIQKLYNISKKKGYNDILNIIFPLFIKYDFIEIYKFIESMYLGYNLNLFVNNYINKIELQNKLNNVNNIFLYMISAEVDMTLNDDVLQNIVLNRTNILYYLYKNDKTRPLLDRNLSMMCGTFITNLITLYYTRNILFNTDIFLISKYTIDEIKNMQSDKINLIYFIFDTKFYVDYKNLPDLKTTDIKLNNFLNEDKSLIYYAIFKEDLNFIKTLNDIYKIYNKYTIKIIYCVLYILMLYKQEISFAITNILHKTIEIMFNDLSFSVQYNIIYLWFYKILDTYSNKPTTELGEFYVSNHEELSKNINSNAYDNISLNTNINESSKISSFIIKFMTDYSKILSINGKIISKYISITGKQFLA
jgi:hypothetical protein